MSTTAIAPDLTQKTRELCQAIVELPNFTEIKQSVDAFMADELIKFKFQMVTQKSEILQAKQNSGAPISNDEIMAFQQIRDELMENPVAKNFLDAQQQLAQIQDSVVRHMTKTFELGRLPSAEDMDDGSCCSSGCGCH